MTQKMRLAIAFLFLTVLVLLGTMQPARTALMADAAFVDPPPSASNLLIASSRPDQRAPVFGCALQPPRNPPNPSRPAALSNEAIALNRFRQEVTTNVSEGSTPIETAPPETPPREATPRRGDRPNTDRAREESRENVEEAREDDSREEVQDEARDEGSREAREQARRESSRAARERSRRDESRTARAEDAREEDQEQASRDESRAARENEARTEDPEQARSEQSPAARGNNSRAANQESPLPAANRATHNPPPASTSHPTQPTVRAPREVIALADPTNYGDRYRNDLNGRPMTQRPIIVLHETVSSASSAVNYFQTPHPRDEDQVSYHTLIARDGTVIYLVPPDKRAFGAGNSEFEGPNGTEAAQTNPRFPSSVNNFAYHVSLESPTDGYGNSDTHSGYSDAQYQSLTWLVSRTEVPGDRITTHKAVDRSGERKDPRSFNAERFLRLLGTYSRSPEIAIGCPTEQANNP